LTFTPIPHPSSPLASSPALRDAPQAQRSSCLLLSTLCPLSSVLCRLPSLPPASSEALLFPFDHAISLPIFYLTIQYCFFRFFSLLNGLSFNSMQLSALGLRYQVFIALRYAPCPMRSALCAVYFLGANSVLLFQIFCLLNGLSFNSMQLSA